MPQRESHAPPRLLQQRTIQGSPHALLTPEQRRALQERMQYNKAQFATLVNRFQQAVADFRFLQQWVQAQRASITVVPGFYE